MNSNWPNEIEVIRVDIVQKEREFLYQINIYDSSSGKFLETFDSFNTFSGTLRFVTHWLKTQNFNPISKSWLYSQSASRTRKFRKSEGSG